MKCLLFSLIFTAIACTMNPEKPSLTLKEACTLAKQEIHTRDAWPEDSLSCEGKKNGTQYELEIWRLPQTPGGFRKVIVSEKGEILAYTKGK